MVYPKEELNKPTEFDEDDDGEGVEEGDESEEERDFD